MKRYVLCFASQIPRPTPNVVLIERQKADWQYGRLNLPGGSVNEGELPEQAAFRELREETGIVSSKPDIEVLGAIVSDDYRVDVCFCPYREWYDGGPQNAKTLTDEGNILTLSWREAMRDRRLIPNLRIIIPFCQSRSVGWQLNPGESDDEWLVGLATSFRGKSLISPD